MSAGADLRAHAGLRTGPRVGEQLAVRLPGPGGVVLEEVRRLGDLAAGLSERLAHLGDEVGSDLGGPLADQRRGTSEDRAAFDERGRGPARRRRLGRVVEFDDILGSRRRDSRHHPPGIRRVEDIDELR
jgi:hypothetical protein